MTEKAPESTSFFAAYKRQLFSPRSLAAMAVAGVLSAAAAYGYWKTVLKPLQEISEKRYKSHMTLMRLYELQLAYRKTHETYAKDLDSLLASAADGPQLRAQLQATVDMATLAVIGDADRFRLEANILDHERTLVKFRGPTGGR